MSVEIKPYFATGERYPALIGVRADGDEYETAYVSKSELADAVRENAELRELVRALLPCYLWSDCYDKTCQVADTPRCPRPSKLLERARELGVEVDG